MLYEKMLVDTYPGFLSLRDENHRIVWLNTNFKEWVALYTDVDPIGKINTELAALVPENVADTFLQCHDGSLDLEKDNAREGLKKVIEFKAPKGSKDTSQYFDVLKYKVNYEEKPYIFTIAYDITDLYLENQQNLDSSLSDTLTSAKNRRYYEEYYQDFKGKMACLFDLDNFKLINDQEGHIAGDTILKEFVDFMSVHLPSSTTMIRLGGDEFLAIFTGDNEKELRDYMISIRKEYEKQYESFKYLSFSFGIGEIAGEIKNSIFVLDDKLYLDKNRLHESRR